MHRHTHFDIPIHTLQHTDGHTHTYTHTHSLTPCDTHNHMHTHTMRPLPAESFVDEKQAAGVGWPAAFTWASSPGSLVGWSLALELTTVDPASSSLQVIPGISRCVQTCPWLSVALCWCSESSVSFHGGSACLFRCAHGGSLCICMFRHVCGAPCGSSVWLPGVSVVVLWGRRVQLCLTLRMLVSGLIPALSCRDVCLPTEGSLYP